MELLFVCLEPSGLSRSHGKKLKGMSLAPWERGKSLVWDVTVSDSLAPTYRSAAVSGVAELAEFKKLSNLLTHIFLLLCPLARWDLVQNYLFILLGVVFW